MSTVAPEVQEARELLESRLSTLDTERKGIEDSLAALPLNGSRPKRKPGRPPKRSTRTKSAPGRTPTGRKRRKGTRRDQALDLVNKAGEAGITASAIAKAMKIKPNYLYRVMGSLEKEKLVRKDGRTYFPVS